MKDIKTKRAAIYARVSTDGQTTDNQLCELHLVAERNDWPIVQEFVDQCISGAKGRDQRPAFNALWKEGRHQPGKSEGPVVGTEEDLRDGSRGLHPES